MYIYTNNDMYICIFARPTFSVSFNKWILASNASEIISFGLKAVEKKII